MPDQYRHSVFCFFDPVTTEVFAKLFSGAHITPFMRDYYSYLYVYFMPSPLTSKTQISAGFLPTHLSTPSVTYNAFSSTPFFLSIGAIHGFILEPLLFSIYTSLCQLIASQSFQCYHYSHKSHLSVTPQPSPKVYLYIIHLLTDLHVALLL